MNSHRLPSYLLAVSDVDGDQLRGLLDTAVRMKEDPYGFVAALRGDRQQARSWLKDGFSEPPASY